MNSVAGSANGNDKIAMWYHDPECINIQYVLGPVVNNFTNVPDDAVKIEIAAGRFAVFETDAKAMWIISQIPSVCFPGVFFMAG